MIILNNGDTTITGVIKDSDKAEAMQRTLSEMFNKDYPTGIGFAKVQINENGSWIWNGKTAGVSPSGYIVGTSPKVMLDKQ